MSKLKNAKPVSQDRSGLTITPPDESEHVQAEQPSIDPLAVLEQIAAEKQAAAWARIVAKVHTPPATKAESLEMGDDFAAVGLSPKWYPVVRAALAVASQDTPELREHAKDLWQQVQEGKTAAANRTKEIRQQIEELQFELMVVDHSWRKVDYSGGQLRVVIEAADRIRKEFLPLFDDSAEIAKFALPRSVDTCLPVICQAIIDGRLSDEKGMILALTEPEPEPRKPPERVLYHRVVNDAMTQMQVLPLKPTNADIEVTSTAPLDFAR